jgi:hypothetical protein
VTGDPKRWREIGSESTAFERALVEAARCSEPPAGASAAVWSGLVARAGSGGSSSSPEGGSSAAPSATGLGGDVAGALGNKAKAASLLTKLVVTAATAAVGAAVVLAAVRGRPTLATDPLEWNFTGANQVPSILASPHVGAVPRAIPETEALRDGALPSRTVPSPAASSDRDTAPAGPTVESSHLSEESLALLAARNLLRGGDARGALAKLDDLRGRFPNGRLAEEREALTIEALANAGQIARASDLAAAFVDAHSLSPLADRIRRFVRRDAR